MVGAHLHRYLQSDVWRGGRVRSRGGGLHAAGSAIEDARAHSGNDNGARLRGVHQTHDFDDGARGRHRGAAGHRRGRETQVGTVALLGGGAPAATLRARSRAWV